MMDEAITNPPRLAPAAAGDTALPAEVPPAPLSPPEGAIPEQVPAPPPTFAPVTPGERLGNLDFARGMALLGILFVNVASFFGPFAALMSPAGQEKLTGIDRVAFLLVLSLFATKFISIFSMLFGYGLTGQIERAAARGGAPVWFTLRRLLALAGFGLAHALLLWYGDILFVYAVIGVWMLVARYLPTRWLIIVAVSLLLLMVALRGGFTLLQAGSTRDANAPPPTAGSEVPYWLPSTMRPMWEAGFNPSSPIWVNAETAAYRDGPFADAFTFRAVTWVFIVIVSVVVFGGQVLGMFVLGAALYRLRFFDADRAPLRRRVLQICLPLGLSFEAAGAFFYWSYSPTADLWAWGVAGTLQQAGLLFLPLGYLALFALAADRLPRPVSGAVGNAGRMSLTVYLGETVLATALSYWWGLQLFARVGPAVQVGLALLIWLTLVGFSTLWLRRFKQGPMEWLWRRLAYGRGAAG